MRDIRYFLQKKYHLFHVRMINFKGVTQKLGKNQKFWTELMWKLYNILKSSTHANYICDMSLWV